jgi:hypothetical protein
LLHPILNKIYLAWTNQNVCLQIQSVISSWCAPTKNSLTMDATCFITGTKMLGYEVVVPPARVELASVFILTWSKQSVIEMMMTLGSITLFHQRQVHVQIRW